MGIDAVIQFETSRPLTIKEMQNLSYALGERFSVDSFYKNTVGRNDEEQEMAENKILLFDKATWSEPHTEGWTAYTLNNMDRYYGPGYERGRWPWIYAQIRFLRDFIHLMTSNEVEVDVWYGGDSGDVESLLMTDDILDEHWALFVAEGRTSYTGSMGTMTCPVCGGRAVCYGFSGGEEMFCCHGCDWNSHPQLKIT